MSAIWGVWKLNETPVVADELVPMMDALAVYGPDGQVTWQAGSVALGHQMLWVTPESRNESLPWCHPHLDLTITADARIDNRADLFAALQIPPDRWADMPDSQLILYAYEKWGQDCPQHLLGDFAFAIWDGRTRTLFCARDQLGIKPFYYSWHPACFVFASDIRGVLAGPGVPCRPNMAFIATYLSYPTFMYHPSETFHKDVQKLPPAQTLTINARSIALRRYWHYEDLPALCLSSDTEYAEMLCDLLTRAVHCRMRSAYPVGTHLSGGLDSSIITVLAARYLRELGQQLTSFSWSPPPTDADRPFKDNDERRRVEAVAEQEGITVFYTQLQEQDIWNWWTQDISILPLTNTPAEPVVCRMASAKNIRVMLSGWGGDQGALPTWMGYLSELFLQGRWQALWDELNAWSGGSKRKLWKGLKAMVVMPILPGNLYQKFQPYYVHPRWPGLLKSEVIERFGSITPLDNRNLRIYSDVRTNRFNAIQQGRYVQRIEAWNAAGALERIEYRYPLLDRRVVEFGMTIPSQYTMRKGHVRFILHQATKNILPLALHGSLLKGDPVMNQSNHLAQRPVIRGNVIRFLSREVPLKRLLCLDENRLKELQANFDCSWLWLGFDRAVRTEYVFQYQTGGFRHLIV